MMGKTQPAPAPSCQLSPMGDTALLIRFEGDIHAALSDYILLVYAQLVNKRPAFIEDIVPAYNSICLFWSGRQQYDLLTTENRHIYEVACAYVTECIRGLTSPAPAIHKTVTRIPVCYESPMAPDIEAVASAHQVSIAEVIERHCTTVYRVYMIGFMPGFAYMGEVPAGIVMPRKSRPYPVQQGSVGIAGNQTGIYPFHSPGGWHIIGRTPLQMFNPILEQPVLLQPGDSVQFYPISTHEYTNYQGGVM